MQGGLEAWKSAGKETVGIQEVSAQEFIDGLANGSIENPVDVRKPGEFAGSHVEGVTNLPLDQSRENTLELDSSKTYHIHCAGGYRSLIYASIARANGIENVVNVIGGYGEIKETQLGKIKLT